MKEKRKNNQRSYRRFAIKYLKLVIVILLIVVAAGYLLSMWLFGGYVKSSLDTEYRLEAQHLYENPSDGFISVANDDDLGLIIGFGLNANYTDYNSRLCFDLTFVQYEEYDMLSWTELIVNKQIVKRSLDQWRYGFVYFTMPAHAIRCIDGQLDKGYHIIEFRMKTSFFSSPFYIRKIALYIE